MPRYYLHVFNDEIALDEVGRELPGLEAAKREALAGARALICEGVRKGHVNLDHRIEIEAEGREHLLTLTFGEAFTIEGLGVGTRIAAQ